MAYQKGRMSEKKSNNIHLLIFKMNCAEKMYQFAKKFEDIYWNPLISTTMGRFA